LTAASAIAGGMSCFLRGLLPKRRMAANVGSACRSISSASSSLDTSGGLSCGGGASDGTAGGCNTYRSPPTRPSWSANCKSIQIWCACRPPLDDATPPSCRTLNRTRCWCSVEAASQSAWTKDGSSSDSGQSNEHLCEGAPAALHSALHLDGPCVASTAVPATKV